MDLALFFSPTDRVRAELTLHKIANFKESRWAITGGLAIEMHLYQHAVESFIRPLHDIDFMTALTRFHAALRMISCSGTFTPMTLPGGTYFRA